MALLVVVGLAVSLAVAGSESAAAAPGTLVVAGPSGDWPDLEATVAQQGVVPVIVTLKSTGTLRAPDQLGAAELNRQKQDVAASQRRLDGEMGGKKLRSYKAMDDIPLLAFHADAADLAKLKRSMAVASVLKDEERVFPQPDGGSVADSASDASGTLGTSSNGQTNQLTPWWDYYRIGVDKAYAAGYRGQGQTVAIIDTGVDRTHPWIKNVVNEACFATASVGSAAGYCPNGKWTQLGLGAAAPCPWTGCGHGTHVAHTAAGANGVASGANIMAIRIFHPIGTGIGIWDSDITWAMKHVYDNRAAYRIAAANLSIGATIRFTGYCDTAYAASTDQGKVGGWINLLKTVGIASVISSGNDSYRGAVGYPACFASAVTVGNTTIVGTVDHVYVGSNSGPQVDLLAPGTDICSALPYTAPGNGSGCDWIGTSMAAPHVAGAFALLRQRRPAATVDQIVSALQRSGVAVPDGYGITRSRIDVYRALSFI